MHALQEKKGTRSWWSEFGPVCCGRIASIDDERRPLVDFPGNPGEPVVARCLDTFRLEGRSSPANLPVLLVFEHGDPARPIILGALESAVPSPAGEGDAPLPASGPPYATVDGRRVILRGDEEVTLVCGRSSITLTKEGRISLRGAEIVSCASGANKIRGASVNIN